MRLVGIILRVMILRKVIRKLLMLLEKSYIIFLIHTGIKEERERPYSPPLPLRLRSAHTTRVGVCLLFYGYHLDPPK